MRAARLRHLFPSNLWLSLSCKANLASSSSSSIFPSLICGVVRLKIPSGPKISIVRNKFLSFLYQTSTRPVSSATGNLHVPLCFSAGQVWLDPNSSLSSSPTTARCKVYHCGGCKVFRTGLVYKRNLSLGSFSSHTLISSSYPWQPLLCTFISFYNRSEVSVPVVHHSGE